MPPIIAFVSQKGGAGKSAIGYSLAWELQRRHGRVLIVDMDGQLSLRKQVARAKKLGLDPPEVMAVAEEDVGRAWKELRERASDYAAVVIDTPGRSGKIQRAALMAADLAVVPVVFEQMGVDAEDDTLETLREAKKRRPKLEAAIVINQQLSRGNLAPLARAALKALGLPIFKTELYTRQDWRAASNAHVGVAEYARSRNAGRELRNLTTEIERLTDLPRGR